MSIDAILDENSADLVSQKYQELVENHEADSRRFVHKVTEAERSVQIGLKIIEKLSQSYLFGINEKNLLIDVFMIKVIPKMDSGSREKMMQQFERVLPEGQKRRQDILSQKRIDLASVVEMSPETIQKMVSGNEQDQLIHELHHLFVKKLQGCSKAKASECFLFIHENISNEILVSFLSFLNKNKIDHENPLIDVNFLLKMVKHAPEFLEFEIESATHLIQTLSSALGAAQGMGCEELFMSAIRHSASKGKKNLVDFMNLLNRAPFEKIIALMKTCEDLDAFVLFLETFNQSFNERGAILPELVTKVFKKFSSSNKVSSFVEFVGHFRGISEKERFDVVCCLDSGAVDDYKLDDWICFFKSVPDGECRLIFDRAKDLFLRIYDLCEYNTLDFFSALHLIQAVPVEQRDGLIEKAASLLQAAKTKRAQPNTVVSFLLYHILFPNREISYKTTRIIETFAGGGGVDPRMQIGIISRAARLHAMMNSDFGMSPFDAMQFLHGLDHNNYDELLEQVPALVSELNLCRTHDVKSKIFFLKFVSNQVAVEERVDFIKLLCCLIVPSLAAAQQLKDLSALERRDKVEELNFEYEFGRAQASLLNRAPETLTINPANFSEEERNLESPLLLLFFQLTRNPRFPRIRYEGSIGSDYGGLTRDFVSQIFSSLCRSDQKSLPLFEAGERYLPMLMEPEGQTLSIETQTRCWQAIGMLFARTLNGDLSLNQASVTTGTHFHPQLFAMIHALTLDELNRIPDRFEENSVPDIKLKLTRLYLKSQYPNIFSPLGLDEAIVDEEIANLVAGRLSDRLIQTRAVEPSFLNDYRVNQITNAVMLIAKSMHRNLILPEKWSRFIGKSAESLRIKIEGSLTSDLVIDAFGLNDENEGTRKGMLKRWIRTANPEKLRDFVYAITGSTSLSSGQNLEIRLCQRLNNPENAPVFHTCGQVIDLPNYESYQTFEQKLEISILSAIAGGFQLA